MTSSAAFIRYDHLVLFQSLPLSEEVSVIGPFYKRENEAQKNKCDSGIQREKPQWSQRPLPIPKFRDVGSK